MSKSQKRYLEFDQFCIDVDERRLLRLGRAVPLTPRVFDVLLELVENGGRTVEKKELIERVWSDACVEEGNLNRNVSTLRKVLGEDSHDPHYIKTVPKRGYRFDCPVREVFEGDELVIVERRTKYSLAVREDLESIDSAVATRSFTSRSAVIAAPLMIVLLAGAAWLIVRTPATDANSFSAATGGASEAVALHRKARSLWQNRSVEGLHQATQYLEQATRLDPGFAPAHAALADAYAFDVGLWRKAEAEANEAIRLDPSLGEPHATIGFIRMFWEWRLTDAETHFRQAIVLSPDYATAHQWYALNFAARRQHGAAIGEIKRALELEPDSLSINTDFCQILYFSRKYDQAIEQCEKTLAIDNQFLGAHRLLYEIYSARGMFEQAVDKFFASEHLSMTTQLTAGDLQRLKNSYAAGGIKAFWRERARAASARNPFGAFEAARYNALLGNRERALEWAERAADARDFSFVFFTADPVYDDLFDHPRTPALAARLQ